MQDQIILEKIRAQFYSADEKPSKINALYDFIRKEYSHDHKGYPPLILAYFAATEGLKGKHSLFPPTQFQYVSDAIAKFNHAVHQEPQKLETRFLRFVCFDQIPAVFGLSNSFPEDLRITVEMLLQKDYSFMPEKYQKQMVNYLLQTKKLDNKQREKLLNLYL